MATLPDAGFRRELGLLDAVVVVAGGIIGVGIFANPSNVARVLHSPLLILLAWTLGGCVALLGGFIWAELGSRLPHVGGHLLSICHGRTRPSSASSTAWRCSSSSTAGRSPR